MKRVLFYVQHLLGVGHLARASRIALAMPEAGLAPLLVTGGAPVAGFPPAEVPSVALPVLSAGPDGFSHLVTGTGAPADADYLARRRDLLLSTFAEFRPDALLVEAYPFGRRQMRFELIPLLEAACSMELRPLVACSVRDLLQPSAKPARARETLDILARFFDLVLVHGDPGFARLEDTFPAAAQILPPVTYTGMVAAPSAAPSPEAFDIVVSAGGGAAGAKLLEAASGAHGLLGSGQRWLLITGANLPDARYREIEARSARGLRVERFRRDFPSLLAACRLSVSQAGYNTVADILAAGCRALLVPFAADGEREQTIRAQKLEARGRCLTIEEADVSPQRLAGAITLALAAPAPARSGMDLDGAAATARAIAGALAGRPQVRPISMKRM